MACAGLSGLQTSISTPELVRGVQLLDISLRMAHLKRMSPPAQGAISAIQYVLRETNIGRAFFKNVARPEVCSGWVVV